MSSRRSHARQSITANPKIKWKNENEISNQSIVGDDEHPASKTSK